MNTRYDRIRIKDGSDRFDPFTVVGSAPVTNSYIDEKSLYGGHSKKNDI